MTAILDRPTTAFADDRLGGARQTIIVGVGRSRQSAAAVALAVRTASDSGARIVVVSVDEGPRGWALWGLHADASLAGHLFEACRLQTSARLARTVRDFRLELLDAVTVASRGNVTTALVDAARRYSAVEIVVGPTSRSRLRTAWNWLTLRSSRVETLRRRCPDAAVTVARTTTRPVA